MKNKISSAEKVKDAAIKILTKQKETLQKQLEEAKYNKSMSISVPESLAYSTEIAVLTKKLDDLQKDIDSFLKTADRIIRQEKVNKSSKITGELENLVLPAEKISPIYDDTLRAVTKISPYEKHFYEKVIKESGNPYLVIQDGVVYCRGHKDVSGFWKLARELQAKSGDYAAAIADFFNREKEAAEAYDKGYRYEIAISDGTTERYYDKLSSNNVSLAIFSDKGYITGHQYIDGHLTGYHKYDIGSDIIIGEFPGKSCEWPITDIIKAYSSRQLEEEQNLSEYE